MRAFADLVVGNMGSVQSQIVHSIAQEVGNPDTLAIEQYRSRLFADGEFPKNLAVLGKFCRRTFRTQCHPDVLAVEIYC